MVGSVRRNGRGFRHTPGAASLLRACVPLLLVLGVLAWPVLESLRAQDKSVPTKEELKKQTITVNEVPFDPLAPKVDLPPPAKTGSPKRPRIFRGQFKGAPPSEPLRPAIDGLPPPVPPGGGSRFQFTIDPKTPLKDLLPRPPKARKARAPLLTDDLSKVPEIEFEAFVPRGPDSSDQTGRMAHTVAKVNFLNAKKTDGFLQALLGERRDLDGLPFAMGGACRTKGERSRQFAQAVRKLRQVMVSQGGGMGSMPGGPGGMPGGGGPAPGFPGAGMDGASAENFWDQYQAQCAQDDKALTRIDREQREHVTRARISALMQVLAPESSRVRLGLARHLATVSHVEATRALACLAIFSAEDEVRQAAVDALKVRRERDYTDVLMAGLRYPLPAVARRAADTLVKLERSDLVPQLVDLLEEPDPRAPVVQEVHGKRVPVVRELVRINHHKNCLLCHAPGNTGSVSPDTLTAGIPIPGQPMPSPSNGYSPAVPDILVRVDVTYLRQDFSIRQAVEDANPWPEMQRFDFLVRTRVLTEEEADVYRTKLEPREPGRLSPYRRSTLAALRELTGKDTDPTPQAWRRLLGQPAKQARNTATP